MSKKTRLALVFNIVLVGLEIAGTVLSIDLGLVDNLIHYTQLSNFLSLIASFILVIYIISKKNFEDIPLWVLMFKYLTVCCLALTFIVVVTVLIPTIFGFKHYLEGFLYLGLHSSMLFFHTLAPIVAIISFILFEGDRRLNKKKTIYMGMLLTVVYGLIMIVLNILGIVVGPYPFLEVMHNPWYMNIIWLVLILTINYIFARLILLGNQINAPRIKRR